MNMGKVSFKQYRSCCRKLEKSKSADPAADFVLEGTVHNYILTFDLAWKLMEDILLKQMCITDFAIGSPREVLQTAFTNGLIGDDVWLQMLKIRNLLVHDYDGTVALREFKKIITDYHRAFLEFKLAAAKYCNDSLSSMECFGE